MKRRLLYILLFLIGQISLVNASTLPANFMEELVATGLTNPTAMDIAPDGRFFVTEQNGSVRIIKNGSLLPTPFLTLTVDSTGEGGLLGITLDPNFETNHYVYIYYSSPTPSIHNRVSRFVANGDVVQAGSETIILDLNNLGGVWNHNGGALHFGPDGKLYIAVGESGTGSNSQTLNNMLGKVLRINPDGTIPTDNPFYNVATDNNRTIWALGLRNPFTFTFQPGTGRMFINDVGYHDWEEINEGVAGANYGWPTYEGVANASGYVDPVYAYAHGWSETTGCAITGGVFYNPTTVQFPVEYLNKYFFADYCLGWIRVYDYATDSVNSFVTNTLPGVIDLRVGADGSLYYLARGDENAGTGGVYRIFYSDTNQPPAITQHPQPVIINPSGSATFSCQASSSQTITYRWQRNQIDIPSANSNSYTLNPVSLTDNGALFRCVASNINGDKFSNDALLTVVDSLPPSATILLPLGGALYQGGQTYTFEGTATDPEDGALAASAFTWQIDFHHNDTSEHMHPFMAATSGIKSGTFTIPSEGETSSNVWYRIQLTVTDSIGLTYKTYRDFHPVKSNLTIMTNQPGLVIELDGHAHTSPYSVTAVAGIQRNINAPTPQMFHGRIWRFASWSDGLAAGHNILTPATDTSYIATFTDYQLENGSFEVDVDQNLLPDSWAARGLTDGYVCNMAHQGNCSLRMVSDGTRKQIRQKIQLPGNENLNLNFWTRRERVRGIGLLQAKVVLFYTDGTRQAFKLKMPKGTADWTQHLLAIAPTKAYSHMKVTFTNTRISGTVWFDDVMLSLP